MVKIYNHLHSNGLVKEIFNQPTGFNNGYIAYLDGETRSGYWEGYAKIIWENRPDIKDQFNSKFNEYLLEFKRQLKLTQQAAQQNNIHPQSYVSHLNVRKLNSPYNFASIKQMHNPASKLTINKATLFSTAAMNIQMNMHKHGLVLADKDKKLNDKIQHRYNII